MQEDLDAWRATGSKFQIPYRLARDAEAHVIARRMEEGLRLTDEADEQSEDLWFVPDLYRVRGELLFEAGDHQQAERCLCGALKGAEEQGVRLLELRAAISLARTLQAQGRHKEVEGRLASIYTQFEEGFDTSDLRLARTLLGQAG